MKIKIADKLNRLLECHSYGKIVNELLQAAADCDKFDPINRDKILHSYWFSFKCRYINAALDSVMDYADILLEDGKLTEDEWVSIRWMRAYLNVDERDFLKHGKEKRIKSLLTSQLRKLYEDNLIEREEAILQSEMQGLFGLSSKQYSEYIEEIKEEAIKNGANKIDLIKNT